jgi:hypothetical protein
MLDLRRELARRRDDERAHRMAGGRMGAVGLAGKALEEGQSKAGSFAGAGLGGAEEVAP